MTNTQSDLGVKVILFYQGWTDQEPERGKNAKKVRGRAVLIRWNNYQETLKEKDGTMGKTVSIRRGSGQFFAQF